MDKIYKGSITKDHLATALVIGGIGVLIVVVTMIVLYLWVRNAADAGVEFGAIALNAGFFFLMFLVGIAACFYLLWRGIHERVIVEGRGLRYHATFFNRSVQALDVEKIMIFDRAQPVVIYDDGGNLKRLKLPVWRSNDYIAGLVADLKRMNPNIVVSDFRESAEVHYEEATPETGKPT